MSEGTPLVLPIVDGLKVVVPDSMDLITPYVLREQGDWFEEEIRFVRRVLEPAQRGAGGDTGQHALERPAFRAPPLLPDPACNGLG